MKLKNLNCDESQTAQIGMLEILSFIQWVNLLQPFSKYARHQQVSIYNHSFLTIFQFNDCKEILFIWLHASKMAVAVWFNAFIIGFPASVFWWNSKSQMAIKLKNSSCDDTQKLKSWWNSKTEIVMKLKNSNCDKTQILTKLKNSNFDKTHTQIVMNLKNSNSDETQKLKLW